MEDLDLIVGIFAKWPEISLKIPNKQSPASHLHGSNAKTVDFMKIPFA
jgi:hypothetical protein